MPVPGLSRGPASFYMVAVAAFAAGLALTLYFLRTMSGGMEMPGGWTMSMVWMRVPGQTWLESAAMFLLMWLSMMVAMMLPSAMPMFRNYHRTAGGAGTATALAACGYFSVWIAAGTVVYAAGAAWGLALMGSAELSRLVPALTGVALVAAGALQLSRWKMSGLDHCRDPRGCGAVAGASGGWSHGLRQGLYCSICCAGLMLALLALGSMNPWVMLTVTIVITVEKLISRPRPVVRLTGLLAVIAGLALLFRSL